MHEVDVADDEVAPAKYDQAARSEQWRDSMLGERTALKNRGCWCVIRTPESVKLIKLRNITVKERLDVENKEVVPARSC